MDEELESLLLENRMFDRLHAKAPMPVMGDQSSPCLCGRPFDQHSADEALKCAKAISRMAGFNGPSGDA